MIGMDGGAAFPRPAVTAGEYTAYDAVEGMSLRDWFAGQALSGEIAGMDQTASLRVRDGETPEDAMRREADVRAAWCYLQADAMLRARSQPERGE